MCILLEPLIGRGAVRRVHPREFKEHVIENRVGLDTLRGRTHALHVITFGKSCKVVIHCTLQTAVHAAAATEVVEHTEDIWTAMIVATVPPRLARSIGEKVKTYKTVTVTTHCTEGPALRHTLPLLDNPLCPIINIIVRLCPCIYSIVIPVEFHHYIGITRLVLHAPGKRALMERVNAVELRHTHHLVQMLIIYLCKCTIALGVGFQDIGACVAAGPHTVVHNVILVKAIYCIVDNTIGHLTAEARDYRLHAKLAHALQHIAAELLLTLVPPVGVTVHCNIGGIYSTAPTLEVVHCKPCNETGACNVVIYILFAHAKFAQEVTCNHIQTHKVQRRVDTVQSHPVNFLLPTFPCPECH